MKKTLIALAVLASSGAAMAQSSVTLYGVADAWFGSTKTEVDGNGDRNTVLESAGVNGSRFGLKGSEDLGGGLKAIFQLENGFNIDNGSMAQGNTLFGRQAYVGLEGSFGTVMVGRQYTAYDDLRGSSNHTGDAATFNATGGVFDNGMADYKTRANNSIKFQTVDYSGFSAAVLYGLGENKNNATNPGGDSTDLVSLNLVYTKGPLMVGYAYQEEKQAAEFLGASQDKYKYNLIAGAYDFGVVQLTGNYNESKNDSTKDTEYQFGALVPFGAAAVSFGYADSKSTRGDMSYKGKGFSLLTTYDMSKRTRLYAGITDTKSHVDDSPAETKIQTYGLGVRHSF